MTAQPKNREPVASTKSKPLSFIQPRVTKRTLMARAPRRFAALMRIVLPGVALIVFAALVIWPFVNPDRIMAVVMQNIPDLVVKNLHFTGIDANNQPYSLSAAKATRPSGTQNVYDLDGPEGEIALDNGAWLTGKAQHGRFNQDTRSLWLAGHVQLFHDNGYQFTSDEAQVDLKGYNAWGQKPVLIQGSFGEITGQGFRLLDSGGIMVIKGPAKAVLNLQDGQASDKPAKASN
jgi:lipopolysaccharide export system protein LptC